VADSDTEFRGQIEERLAAVWRETLGIQSVRRDDCFTQLGDSMAAVLCLLNMRRAFSIEFPLELLTAEGATLEEVAAIVGHMVRRAGQGSPT
jgi:hypothetical protein